MQKALGGAASGSSEEGTVVTVILPKSGQEKGDPVDAEITEG